MDSATKNPKGVLGFGKGKGKIVHAIRENKKLFCDPKREMEPEDDADIIALDCKKCLRYASIRDVKLALTAPTIESEPVFDEVDEVEVAEEQPEPEEGKAIEEQPVVEEPEEKEVLKVHDFVACRLSIGKIYGFISNIDEDEVTVKDEKGVIFSCDIDRVSLEKEEPEWFTTMELMASENSPEANLEWNASKEEPEKVIEKEPEPAEEEQKVVEPEVIEEEIKEPEFYIEVSDDEEVIIEEPEEPEEPEPSAVPEKITVGVDPELEIKWTAGDIVKVPDDTMASIFNMVYARVLKVFPDRTLVEYKTGKQWEVENMYIEYYDPETKQTEIYTDDFKAKISSNRVQIYHVPTGHVFFDDIPIILINALIYDLNSIGVRWSNKYDSYPAGFISLCREVMQNCYRNAGLIPPDLKTLKQNKKKPPRKVLKKRRFEIDKPRKLKRRRPIQEPVKPRKLKRRRPIQEPVRTKQRTLKRRRPKQVIKPQVRKLKHRRRL